MRPVVALAALQLRALRNDLHAALGVASCTLIVWYVAFERKTDLNWIELYLRQMFLPMAGLFVGNFLATRGLTPSGVIQGARPLRALPVDGARLGLATALAGLTVLVPIPAALLAAWRGVFDLRQGASSAPDVLGLVGRIALATAPFLVLAPVLVLRHGFAPRRLIAGGFLVILVAAFVRLGAFEPWSPLIVSSVAGTAAALIVGPRFERWLQLKSDGRGAATLQVRKAPGALGATPLSPWTALLRMHARPSSIAIALVLPIALAVVALMMSAVSILSFRLMAPFVASLAAVAAGVLPTLPARVGPGGAGRAPGAHVLRRMPIHPRVAWRTELALAAGKVVLAATGTMLALQLALPLKGLGLSPWAWYDALVALPSQVAVVWLVAVVWHLGPLQQTGGAPVGAYVLIPPTWLVAQFAPFPLYLFGPRVDALRIAISLGTFGAAAAIVAWRSRRVGPGNGGAARVAVR